MLTLEELKKYGANTDEGLARCFNSEDFYLKLVMIVPDEKGFNNLKNALDSSDLDAAFEAAHALKGVLANLSLTPLLSPVSEITELLRSRTEMDYSVLMNEIMKQRSLLAEICGK